MTAQYDVPLGLYIDGEHITGGGRELIGVLNPATGEVLGHLPVATDADLDRALEATSAAFETWKRETPERRSAILLRAAALLRERRDQIATIATIEQGKPLQESLMEADSAAALLEFHAGEAVRIPGRVLLRADFGQSLVLKQPVGPVAAFCAWNFPIMNVVRKITPAIACGCSVVLKPSEETPGAAIAIFKCFEDAGLPAGVVQFVFGVPDHISRRLLASPITRKLSFTGSVPVGKHLAKLATDTMMKTTMELGGHGPCLVFEDCDVERTLDILVQHKFRNAGQVCVSPTRFYIHDSLYDRFALGFAERTAALRLGNGLAATTRMGPLANPRRTAMIGDLVDDAVASGATLLAGGARREGEGFFFNPTVLGDVPETARAMSEEPFGPIALLNRFANADAAIAAANHLPFGLAAYAFTENARLQRRLATELQSGMVGINVTRMSWPDTPFGGMKDSGQGSEDGPEGIEAHLITKSVHIA